MAVSEKPAERVITEQAETVAPPANSPAVPIKIVHVRDALKRKSGAGLDRSLESLVGKVVVVWKGDFEIVNGEPRATDKAKGTIREVVNGEIIGPEIAVPFGKRIAARVLAASANSPDGAYIAFDVIRNKAGAPRLGEADEKSKG